MKARLRTPRLQDGAGVWQLVKRSGKLDLNSPYAYLLVCDHFASTSLVAEEDGEIVGFVAAYRPPTKPDVIFVWQVGVDDRMRGQGVAGALLQELVALPACEGVRFLETTVTPDNQASEALFRSFARKRGADLTTSVAYDAGLFPAPHESELLFRIGPLESQR